jgi:hypothetical protein
MSEVQGATTVLTFNSGSSSLKFGLYQFEKNAPVGLISGEIEMIGDRCCCIYAADGAVRFNGIAADKKFIEYLKAPDSLGLQERSILLALLFDW